jgi:hypothetical protein
MTLAPSEIPNTDRMYWILTDGSLVEGFFESSAVDLLNIQTIGHVPDAFFMDVNSFDRRLMVALSKTAAYIHFIDSSHKTIKLVCKIEALDGNWAGSQFLSFKSLVLWTTNGNCNVYYLGPRSEFEMQERKAVPEDSIVLFSDGTHVFYTLDLKMGNAASYNHFELLARFESPDDSHSWICCFIDRDPALSRCARHFIMFDDRPGKECGSANVFTFWASVMKSEISPSIHVRYQPSDPILFNSPSHAFNVFSEWPDLKSLNASCVIMVLKKFLCFGTKQGEIYITPFSMAFSGADLDLKACSSTVLQTHGTVITSLCTSEFRQSDRDRLLFAGTIDGWVYIWDLE